MGCQWGSGFIAVVARMVARVAAALCARLPAWYQIAHSPYFSIRNLRLSKNFPPFGRRWLTRIAPKSKSTSTNCAYPP